MHEKEEDTIESEQGDKVRSVPCRGDRKEVIRHPAPPLPTSSPLKFWSPFARSPAACRPPLAATNLTYIGRARLQGTRKNNIFKK